MDVVAPILMREQFPCGRANGHTFDSLVRHVHAISITSHARSLVLFLSLSLSLSLNRAHVYCLETPNAPPNVNVSFHMRLLLSTGTYVRDISTSLLNYRPQARGNNNTRGLVFAAVASTKTTCSPAVRTAIQLDAQCRERVVLVNDD